MLTYEEIRQALKDVPKPCAFLHEPSLNENIEAILEMSGDKKIRIASKSIRSIAVLEKIMAYSDRFQGLMCFTASEASYLYEKGFDDLLVAYPVWDENQLRTVCKLIKQGATITLMIDSVEHLKRLEEMAKKESGRFLVAIDFDLSTSFPGLHFGVYRSPIRSVADLTRLIEKIKESDYVKLDGLMGYEAQIAGVVDNAPGQSIKNLLVRLLKKRSVKDISKKRSEIMKALNREGVQLRFINGGGTGSLQTTKKDAGITEVTAGSGFYQSHLFDKYKDFILNPAVGFAVEITRKPENQIYTCAGGGYVASGSAGKDKLPEIFFPEGASLIANEGVGEVQTPVRYSGPINLKHGDPIIFRHSKAGELCERFHYLYVIKDSQVVEKITTYRGEGKCFL